MFHFYCLNADSCFYVLTCPCLCCHEGCVLQHSDVLLNRALGSTCDVAVALTVQAQGHVGPEYHDCLLKIKYTVIFNVKVIFLLFLVSSFILVLSFTVGKCTQLVQQI